MTRFFSNVCTNKNQQISRSMTSRRARLGCETLESRELLAANITYDAVQRQLLIACNDANDNVIVRVVGTSLQVEMSEQDAMGNYVAGSARTENRPLAGVDKIRFEGNGGGDRFYNQQTLPMYAFGGAGQDRLHSGEGYDYLSGGPGTDWYTYLPGQRGHDYIEEASDADYDILNFSVFGMGVTVDLANASGFQTVNSNLRLFLGSDSGIEQVMGSSQGDYIYGNARNNLLFGNGGQDSLEGRGGNDYLDGGTEADTYAFGGVFSAGSLLGADIIMEAPNNPALDDARDRLYFSNFDHSVQVDLAATGLQTVSAGHLQLTLLGAPWIEDVVGSRFGDTIYGNRLANTIQGLEGNDVINGRAGNDRLYGNAGIDQLAGSRGDDYLDGGFDGQADILKGAQGHDTYASEYFFTPAHTVQRPNPIPWLPPINEFVGPTWTNREVFVGFTPYTTGAAYENYDEMIWRQ